MYESQADPLQKARQILGSDLLLDIAMRILEECFEDNIPRIERSQRNMFIVRRAVRRELRERYGFGAYARYNGDRIVEELIQAGINNGELINALRM